MTDLEKFKNFFDSMNIKYEEYIWDYEEVHLSIDESHMGEDVYNPEITIIFHSNGKFKEFRPIGE